MGYADEFAVVDAFDAVARGADLTVDLESAAEGGTVVGGEEAEVIPGVGCRVEDFVIAFCRFLGIYEGECRGGGGCGSKGDAFVVFGDQQHSEDGNANQIAGVI